MQLMPEMLDGLECKITEFLANTQPAVTYTTENTLWTHEDKIYKELGARLCSIMIDGVHGVLKVRHHK